jgi:TRAP-type C4-dicarboxylate transport system permease large subunit
MSGRRSAGPKSSPAATARSSRPRRPTGAPTDQTGQFVAAVLGSTEAQWKEIFAAGVGPGLVVAATLALTVLVSVRMNPALVGREGEVLAGPDQSRLDLLMKIWPIFLLIALVLGGIYGGFFTPTEAGAIGALGALLLVIVRGRFTARSLKAILLETGKASASIFFLLITAQMYSRMLTLSRLPETLTIWASALQVPSVVILLAFIVVLKCWR